GTITNQSPITHVGTTAECDLLSLNQPFEIKHLSSLLFNSIVHLWLLITDFYLSCFSIPSRDMSNMSWENQSNVSDFLLLGLPILPEQRGLFFALFLGMYLTTVLGNLLIVLLIRLDLRLQTPMYFFLCHLALTDVCLSSVTVPKTLTNLHTNHKSIPYAGCISQTYFLIWFGCLDNFLLAVMAYDRYVAICQPLHYTTIMRQELCVSLVAGSWLFCSLHSLLHTLLLAFCGDKTIHHFFCDLPTLLKMSCSDVSINELLIFIEGGAVIVTPFSGVVGSYIRIWMNVLKDPSAKKFFKVLSTCGSHLLVVSLFYGTIAEVYFFSSSSTSNDKNITGSVMYMIVTPMLNPFIYSLRNRDMKRALETLVNRAKFLIRDTSSMRWENQSSVSEFILLGLPILPEQRGLFFALFLGMYLTTVLGNLLIILLIRLDSRLHTPMYFFLSHLALTDVCLSSVTVPKMLTNMHSNHMSIPYAGCISQTYFFLLLACLDNFLLAVMAYDRYVAICQPLHYTTIMRQELCVSLVAGSWFSCCLHSLLHTLLLAHLSFCGHNTIPHYFCDLTTLLNMSCSDVSLNEALILTEGGILVILPLSGILGSYIRIWTTVLRDPSAKKFFKVLSTCGSHLLVVFLYYGTIAEIYFFSSSSTSNDKKMIASVMYMIVTPLLNPFIYSLRNRDMRHALERLVTQAKLLMWENQSSVSEFLLLGLPILPELRGLFFALFLGMYLTMVLGNLLIVLLIRLDSRLHTPMYFFLSHLAFADVCFSSVTVPKMLWNMQTNRKSIPYAACISQIYVFILFGYLDNLLLAVMAYDRYVAICQPLHYTTIMRQELCISLLAGSWFISNLHSLLHTLLLARLSFCADKTIHHFFCELTVLLSLSCSDISLNELFILTEGGALVILPFSGILGSYIRIWTTVLRDPSAKKFFKVLSTCGSHLLVVSLYYGTMTEVYFFSSSSTSNNKRMTASVMYMVITPMLNPFIYSLRNRDIKRALETLINRVKFLIRDMSNMRWENQSSVSEFLLLGLPILPEQQGLFFALFLGMYLTTVLGNLLIVLLIRMNSHLHTPMYFFLSHLAFADVCFSSVTVPKMLWNMQTNHKSIPYAGCISQTYFLIWFGCLDNFLLAVMAYDRYVAICQPLHYTTIMRQELCVSLVAGSWLFCSLHSLLHTLLLAFCGDKTIHHFFCDLPTLLKMSCSDVSINELLIFIEGGMIVMVPLSGILGSYIRIWTTVLRDPSAKKFFKVLSTCGSHLLVVSLFYGTIAEVYFFSSSSTSNDKNITGSVMYMIVTPMLNPFIYSLRNRDMKRALETLDITIILRRIPGFLHFPVSFIPSRDMSNMRWENQSSTSEFLLLGLPILPEQRGLFFALFLGMYLTTVLGNLLIVLLIRLDSRLHTPMYFFLSHLAFSDVCFSSVTVPKMLWNMQTNHKFIPYAGCIVQMYFFLMFVCLDNFLLAVMAYDRYVAICQPLHYTTIMRQEMCVSLVAACWFFSNLHSLLHTLLLARLSFCGDKTIPHFFCDLSALMKMSCSDISLNELVVLIEAGFLAIMSLSGILGSYIRIWTTVLRDPSAKKFFKVLSTCDSHLLVVFLFYGTIAEVYFFSSSSTSSNKNITASVMYVIVTPMLNPFIYSLRNKDMKRALQILINRVKFLMSKDSI
ncbi:Olfactory receptor 1J4, partial [Galemys pyrenaicus]